MGKSSIIYSMGLSMGKSAIEFHNINSVRIFRCQVRLDFQRVVGIS